MAIVTLYGAFYFHARVASKSSKGDTWKRNQVVLIHTFLTFAFLFLGNRGALLRRQGRERTRSYGKATEMLVKWHQCAMFASGVTASTWKARSRWIIQGQSGCKIYVPMIFTSIPEKERYSPVIRWQAIYQVSLLGQPLWKFAKKGAPGEGQSKLLEKDSQSEQLLCAIQWLFNSQQTGGCNVENDLPVAKLERQVPSLS